MVAGICLWYAARIGVFLAGIALGERPDPISGLIASSTKFGWRLVARFGILVVCLLAFEMALGFVFSYLIDTKEMMSKIVQDSKMPDPQQLALLNLDQFWISIPVAAVLTLLFVFATWLFAIFFYEVYARFENEIKLSSAVG